MINEIDKIISSNYLEDYKLKYSDLSLVNGLILIPNHDFDLNDNNEYFDVVNLKRVGFHKLSSCMGVTIYEKIDTNKVSYVLYWIYDDNTLYIKTVK